MPAVQEALKATEYWHLTSFQNNNNNNWALSHHLIATLISVSSQTILTTCLMPCLLCLKSRTPAQPWAPLTYRPAASATRPSTKPPYATVLPSAWTPHSTALKGPSATALPRPLLRPETATALWVVARPLSLAPTVTQGPLTMTLGPFD